MSQLKGYRTLIRLHAWQYKKQPGHLVLLLVFLMFGFYGLFQGYSVKRLQTTTIALFKHEKDSVFYKFRNALNADTSTKEGNAAFKEASSLFILNWGINLPVAKYPVSASIFSTGQSDVYPYYYIIRPESFIMQIFKQTEITNPLRSLAGHFDTVFWVIYLMPLLVLLLCFNTLSAELDNGNWKLIKATGTSENKWMQSRFILAGSLITVLLIILFLTGLLVNFISFGQSPSFRDCLFFSGAALYLFLWLSLFYFINSLQRSTGYNALVSGLCWITICIVLPALVSKLAELVIPVDNTNISTFSRRPQDTRIDEQNGFAVSLITAFTKRHPLYSNADTMRAKPSFQSRVYRAWHTMLDESRWPQVTNYYYAVEKRQQITNASLFINPAGSMDGVFSGIANNDVNSQFDFLQQCLQFHRKLQNATYPALFADKTLTIINYDRIPVFNYQPAPVSRIVYVVFLLIFVTGSLLYGMAVAKLKRI